MKKYCLLLAILLGCATAVMSQDIEQYPLDASTHGMVINKSPAGTRIWCTGVDSAHSVGRGYDYWVTVVGDCTEPYTMAFVIENLDMRFSASGNPCADTLFIYDGLDTSAPVIWYATGSVMMPSVTEIFASPNNAVQALTVRMKVCNDCGPWDYSTGSGFRMVADCRMPCETFTPVLDSIFYKTRNGVVYEAGMIKHLFDYDSIKALPLRTKGSPSLLKVLDSLTPRTYYWRSMKSSCAFRMDKCDKTVPDTIFPRYWNYGDTALVPIRQRCADSTYTYCKSAGWKDDSLALGSVMERQDTIWHTHLYYVESIPECGAMNKFQISAYGTLREMIAIRELFSPSKTEKFCGPSTQKDMFWYDMSQGYMVPDSISMDSLRQVWQKATVSAAKPKSRH